MIFSKPKIMKKLTLSATVKSNFASLYFIPFMALAGRLYFDAIGTNPMAAKSSQFQRSETGGQEVSGQRPSPAASALEHYEPAGDCLK